MKKKLVFASNNAHKLEEIALVLQDTHFEVESMHHIGCTDDIPETGNTFIANALQKARYLHQRYKIDCFADDSGLEIEALDGAPGVNSAHYSGTRDHDANIDVVLQKMMHNNNRKAQFKTVIALILNSKEHIFEGIVDGEITQTKIGTQGFGYDPIFRPQDSSFTFAEMTIDEKNKISHRKRALEKMLHFLKS